MSSSAKLAFRDALGQALRGSYLRRALVVALVVGTLLNLINQPEALFGSLSVQWGKLLLTYMVPFCVATYGAASALSQSHPGSQPTADS